MKKPTRRPSNPNDDLQKNLGIPAYKKQAVDDGVNGQKEHKEHKKGKCNCNCKK